MSRSNVLLRRFTDIDGKTFDVMPCLTCGAEFSRPTVQGVRPFNCPDHAAVFKARPAKPVLPTVATIPATVNPTPANPRHYRYSLIKAILMAGVHVFLVGPPGSGKSTVADQIAEDMGLEFYAESGHELMTAYDLLGFKNAMGEFILTYLCQAIEHGGLFLMDEMDAMNSAAMIAMNRVSAMKPGQRIRIGDREIIMHVDFHLIGGGNTWGRGPDANHPDRMEMDQAVLDRFACIDFGYDAHLEFIAAGVAVPSTVPANPRFKKGHAVEDAEVTEWVTEVQRYRIAFERAQIQKAVITPRASINGGKMMRAGIHKDYVVASLIRKGLSDEEWRSVKGAMPVPVAA